MSENEDSGPLAVSESRFLMAICTMAVFFYSTVASSQHLHFFTVRSPAALAVKLTLGFGQCVASARYTWRVDQVGATREHNDARLMRSSPR
eukprot:COSAG01_NODE_749_length_13846_cov_205.366097_9_plen_91_part_00